MEKITNIADDIQKTLDRIIVDTGNCVNAVNNRTGNLLNEVNAYITKLTAEH